MIISPLAEFSKEADGLDIGVTDHGVLPPQTRIGDKCGRTNQIVAAGQGSCGRRNPLEFSARCQRVCLPCGGLSGACFLLPEVPGWRICSVVSADLPRNQSRPRGIPPRVAVMSPYARLSASQLAWQDGFPRCCLELPGRHCNHRVRSRSDELASWRVSGLG